MGCDIHLYREKYVNGKWQTADYWVSEDDYTRVPYEKRAYKGRNYSLFGLLSSGVRADFTFSFPPRGMPFNASHEVAKAAGDWGSDGHSHSYLYLFELRQLAEFLKSKTIPISGMKDAEQLKKLHESIDSGNPDWGLLFPYCQSTNQSSYVDFEIDVPAEFYVGGCLKRIIDSFEGVDGENHRAVFFFDN